MKMGHAFRRRTDDCGAPGVTMAMRTGVVLLLFVPCLIAAQTTDVLRARIWADVIQDPRTATFSALELDALGAALASDEKQTGDAATREEIFRDALFADADSRNFLMTLGWTEADFR